MNKKSNFLIFTSAHRGFSVCAAGVLAAWLIGILLSIAVFYIPGLHRSGTHVYSSLGTIFALIAPFFSITISSLSRIPEFELMLSFQRTRREYYFSCLLSDLCAAVFTVFLILILSQAEKSLAMHLPDIKRLLSFAHFLTVPNLLFFAVFLTCLCTVLTWLFVQFGSRFGVLLLCTVIFLITAVSILCRRLSGFANMLKSFLMGILRIPHIFILLPIFFCILFLIIGWQLCRRSYYKD